MKRMDSGTEHHLQHQQMVSMSLLFEWLVFHQTQPVRQLSFQDWTVSRLTDGFVKYTIKLIVKRVFKVKSFLFPIVSPTSFRPFHTVNHLRVIKTEEPYVIFSCRAQLRYLMENAYNHQILELVLHDQKSDIDPKRTQTITWVYSE